MTIESTYRRLRREDPYLPASIALSVARGAADADALGIGWGYHDADGGTVAEIDGQTYRVRLRPDEGWWGDPYDDDCHGEVVDRWDCTTVGNPRGSSGVYYDRDEKRDRWDGWSHDRADGETVLVLDERHAYRVDNAAESVTALADHYNGRGIGGRGMARGPARDAARANLRRDGERLHRDLTAEYGPPIYGVEVEDGTGDIEGLYGVDLPDDDAIRSAYSLAYLAEIVRELADELDARRTAEADALRDRFGHLPGLPVRDCRGVPA